MSMQWLEKCISVQRLVPPTSIPIDSMGAYFFEAPVVQYFLPTALKGLNPFDSVNTSLCWSHILLDLPWTNKFSFNCKWIRNMKSNFNSDRFKNDLLDDEIYLVTESESLLVHKSILSARSGKLAAAIRFTEAQELCVAEDGKLSVRIDLPLQLAKMLVSGKLKIFIMVTPCTLDLTLFRHLLYRKYSYVIVTTDRCRLAWWHVR